MRAIHPAITLAALAEVRGLFEAYSASLPIDLSLQHLGTELATLPGAYAPPRGALLLAYVADAHPAVGCIGMRPFTAEVGEIKRLYVQPTARGQGVARALVAAAIAAGQRSGYRALVLDTLESMHAAHALYASFGFRRTEAYAVSPYPDVAYFRLAL